MSLDPEIVTQPDQMTPERLKAALPASERDKRHVYVTKDAYGVVTISVVKYDPERRRGSTAAR